MNKTFIISTIVVLVLGIFFFANREKTPKVTTYDSNKTISQNVSSSEGKQIVEVSAKGGYTPKLTTAQANVPTILRVTTSATFDCSSALRIPTLGYSTNLPPTGTTDIEVPAQKAGTTLKALCSMGMYNFSINFKS
jgi:plastocyanin domain-containing protein